MPNRKESAGAKFLREHYNEVAERYPREWVAIGAEGVLAHHREFARITHANAGGVAFAYMKPALAPC